MAFKPSPYQMDVFRFVRDEDESLIIEAVAGSGKTTTIVGTVKLIPKTKRVMFVAFNKSIAEELATRLPEYVNCCTMNALGHRAWMRHVGTRIKLNAKKTYDVLDSAHIQGVFGKSEVRSVRYPVIQLVGYAKSVGIVPMGLEDKLHGLQKDTDGAWRHIINHFNVDMNVKRDGKSQSQIRCETEDRTKLAIEIARKALEISIEVKDEIDFNDQLYMTVIHDVPFPKNDFVFVDEAQDISHIQRIMLKKSLKKGGRLIAVGDPCQPTGTMVTVIENKKGKFHGGDIIHKPIENLNIGDSVVSYNMQQGQFTRGRKINGITKRMYEGIMVDIITESGLTTKYTPNHHCIASFEPLRGKYALYLMSKENEISKSLNYRVGVCKMDYGNTGSGLSARFRAENADKCWILGIFDNRNDALYHEAMVSHAYQIPMLRFNDNTKSATFPQPTLDNFWNSVGDMTELGKLCILSHDKSPQYPLFTQHDAYKTLKRPIVVNAINLESGCAVLPYKESRISYKKDYEPIIVTRSQYNGFVYSMDIECDHTYIGDGIATHNCQAIYGFRGADNLSLQNIGRDFNTKSLPLSISYRCPKNIVAEAQEYVPHILPHDDAPDGTVEQLGTYNKNNLDVFQPDDFVLCRNVAPLVKLAFSLIAAGKPAGILGRDIGKTISKLIEKLKANDLTELRAFLSVWEKEEIERIQQTDPESTGGYIKERADTVRMFISSSGATTVKGVLSCIDELFDDNIEGAVKLSTIHKSKGLEAKRVIILDRQLMPSKYATKPWQKEQENNLIYVAITRSMDYLGYIHTPDGDE